MLRPGFANRVLPFDSAAARAYAEIVAARRAAGRPVSQSDGQIAAIAHSRGMAVATRNIRDFEDMGIALINPWVSA
jgi:predicted nucleic acid-binding protein